jgi:hypothetical protein
MSTWHSTVQNDAPDPLADFLEMPIISAGGPGMNYIGRVIVELWDTGESPTDDSRSIAVSADARLDNEQTLVERVAAALPKLLSRGPLFRA